MTSSRSTGTGTQMAKAIADLEQLRPESANLETFFAKLARTLRVSRHEVAVLRIEKNCLRFIYPAELRDAGFLPLSGSAVAARTATTRSPLLSNAFAKVRHVSLFESVKLDGKAEEDEPRQLPIQKIISVPIAGPEGRVLGVIQLSRKGLDPSLAGSDFTSDDLKLVEKAAQILAGMPFMQEDAALEAAAE